MKTPTLEEVKEYFKNAKEVRCLANGKVYSLTNGHYEHNIDSDGGFYTYEFDDDYVVIYTAKNGYAKIVNKTKDKDTYTVSKDFILEAHKKTLVQLGKLK